jgi:hypothetical protein
VTLAGMLAASLGIEVVDLARTDLTSEHLPSISRCESPRSQPDAIVLFAGNNWSSIRLELGGPRPAGRRGSRTAASARCRAVSSTG